MAEQISNVALHTAAQGRYLNYALSVITSRALPDVRDGLKPVQRRILYSMYHDLKLTHDAKHRKSAAVVGNVMAKYHPHGDQAIYDAMVRMAQSFSLRYPLVNGQGNFGSIDGDGAAAMRYTEARLESLSERLLEELRKKTVAMRPNYDGQYFEPVVLPSQLPNLLLNGTTGIAVGMATNIPPHNLRELCKACVRLIDNPNLDSAALMKFVKGPDFPTGGRMLNTDDELLKIYETGSGTIKMVGEYEVESEGVVIITSVPFMINKANLVEKIAEHIRSGNVPQIEDVRDESTDEIRVVLELADGASPHAAMAFLYKNTDLQSRFHVNMTCLVPASEEDISGPGPSTLHDEGATLVPRRIGLAEMLRHFLDFRLQVVTRRLQHDLEQLERRIHLLEAFEIIFNALDEVLRLIRQSDGRRDAAEKLKARFGLDDVQADAILDTRLYRLARLEIDAIRQELAEKREEAARIRSLLSSEEALWGLIKEELRTLNRKYGDPRRTAIGSPEEELEYNTENYILKEDAVVVVTRGGWVRRQRSYSEIGKLRLREGDAVGWVFRAKTHQCVTLFTNKGRAYTLRAGDFPQTSGYGDPIQAHFDFSDGERIVGLQCTDPRTAPGATAKHWDAEENDVKGPPIPEYHLIALSKAGNVVRFHIDTFNTPSNRSGRSYVRLEKKAPDGSADGIVGVYPTTGDENVCVVSHKSRALVFSVSDAPMVKGRGKGATALKLAKNDVLMGFALSKHRDVGLEVKTNRGRHEKVCPRRYAVARRGRKGRPILLRGYISELLLSPTEIRHPDEIAAERAAEKEAAKRALTAAQQADVADGEATPNDTGAHQVDDLGAEAQRPPEGSTPNPSSEDTAAGSTTSAHGEARSSSVTKSSQGGASDAEVDYTAEGGTMSPEENNDEDQMNLF